MSVLNQVEEVLNDLYQDGAEPFIMASALKEAGLLKED